MTLLEYIKKYKSLSRNEKTQYFNEFSIRERKVFLNGLSAKEKRAFITQIRKQAVLDFWTHEKENIKNGTCTRAWTPEQIEVIMHISEKSGKELKNGAIAYFGEQAA